MDWVQVVSIARDLGFPIIVAVWFMFRLEKKLDKWVEMEHAEQEVLIEIRDELRRANGRSML